MSEGGFNLRKWNSNSPELISRITSASGQPARDSAMDNSQKGDGAPSQFIAGSNAEENDQFKLLGIIWNSNSDDLIFCFTELIDMLGKLQAN